MKYVHFTYYAPCAGSTEEEWVSFPEHFPEDTITDFANEGAESNGENWEHLVWDEVDGDCTEEEIDRAFENYWTEVYGHWDYCTKEEWEENAGYEY